MCVKVIFIPQFHSISHIFLAEFSDVRGLLEEVSPAATGEGRQSDLSVEVFWCRKRYEAMNFGGVTASLEDSNASTTDDDQVEM